MADLVVKFYINGHEFSATVTGSESAGAAIEFVQGELDERGLSTDAPLTIETTTIH